MNVNVKTTDFNMTPEASAHLNSKIEDLEKLLPAHDPDTVQCDVELARSVADGKEVWRAEINLSNAGGFYRTDAKGESVQAAIDEAKEEMLRRLRRTKRKRLDIVRRGGAKIKEWVRFGRRA